jgi:hypothetical protein
MGICFAYCAAACCPTELHASELSGTIIIRNHVNGLVRKGSYMLKLDVFSECMAYGHEYNFKEFPNVDLDKVFIPERYVEDVLICKYREFLDQKTTPFIPAMVGEFLYIGSSLSRCFIAHLIGDEQMYFECTNNVFHNPVKFDFNERKLQEFSRSILQPPGLPALELESKDPAIIHAIELRFIGMIIVKLNTFDIKPHIEQIYHMLENQRQRIPLDKARASRVAFGEQ